MPSSVSPHGGEVAFSGAFSSIVGYHLNPWTCGVAKFNAQLAERLRVPVVSAAGPASLWGDRPFLSLKWSEMDAEIQHRLQVCGPLPAVLWHGEPGRLPNVAQHLRADVLGAPSLLGIGADPDHWRLFTFGMAHKLLVEPYREIDRMMRVLGLSYTLEVSVALHEGTRLDETAMHFDALYDVTQGRVKVLGCLSDEALAERLRAAHVVCAFFPDGARANNTSVNAAMALGRPVLTNLDAQPPAYMRHGETVMDLAQTRVWPAWTIWERVGWRAGLRPETGWGHFMEVFRAATA